MGGARAPPKFVAARASAFLPVISRGVPGMLRRMTTDQTEPRPDAPAGAIARAFGALERAGNKLPGPLAVFALLAALVVLASFVAARRHLSAVHPETGANIAVANL